MSLNPTTLSPVIIVFSIDADGTLEFAIIKRFKTSAITAATGKSVAELKRTSPDGTDITQTPIMGPSAAKVQTTVGKPANLGDYFFLPALGAYYHSGFNPNGPGQSGYYWLSSSSTYDAVSHSGTAFCLVFDDSHARIENEIRMLGFRVWNAQ